MDEDRLIALFPLGLVMLPGLPVPLHIFEERYKQMIGACIEADEVFGIVFYDGGNMRTQGCTARVVDVIRRYEDGRFDILCEGMRRFTLRKLDHSRPYLQGAVRYFDDTDTPPLSPEMDALVRKGIDLLGAYAGSAVDLPAAETDYRAVSFLIAGCEGFNPAEKQQFLEMTSTAARLVKSVAALEMLLRRLKVTEEIRRIIGGNGQLSGAPILPDSLS
jgi:Lon protease-like protein